MEDEWQQFKAIDGVKLWWATGFLLQHEHYSCCFGDASFLMWAVMLSQREELDVPRWDGVYGIREEPKESSSSETDGKQKLKD